MSKYISVRHKHGTYCDLLFGSEVLYTLEHYTDGEFVEGLLNELGALDHSLRNELVAAHETITDYQEQTATLIQSNVEYADALELVNEQLATVQAERDTWRSQGVEEWKSERKAFALTLAELNSKRAEVSAMNVDNTKLWKENELSRQQLGAERTTADSFNSEFRYNPNGE